MYVTFTYFKQREKLNNHSHGVIRRDIGCDAGRIFGRIDGTASERNAGTAKSTYGSEL
jgi:hypothetical protein